ncbi:MAG: methyltransferase [Gammaproteobacteria bacterium]|nr:methyltransferase [Gammaproteobacteria bacterium]
MNHAARLAALEELLLAHQGLWQAQPFKQARPDWCTEYPELTAALLTLDETQLAQLSQDEAALWPVLAAYLPSLAALSELCRLPRLPGGALSDPGPHFANHIPGRKWQQIQAFSAALGPGQGPWLEWCGGKGHLGRLLSWQYGQPVTSLEWDGALCEDGERLARRSGITQRFERLDVLTPAASLQLPGRHALALHACGELHRQLLREGVAHGVAALDLAPCCYHHLQQGDYQPFSPQARLRLRRDDLRLAVTGAATAPARELRRRDQEMAWKLGYLALHGQLTGEGYKALRPIDKSWLRGDFAAFCRWLAAREGDTLPAGPDGEPDWAALEQLGWQRQRETMRLSLLRQGFRRAIELWLVHDMACYLETHGYRVRVGEFCASALSPRNLLISARRETK